MTKAMDVSKTLKTLAEREPSLIARLKEAKSINQAANIIMQSAQQHGLKMDALALEHELQAAARRQAEMISTLQEVIRADPSLKPALKQVAQVDEVVDLIIASAQRQGVVLDADELATQISIIPETAAGEELNDEELADVSGGLAVTTVLVIAAAGGGIALLGGVGGFMAGMLLTYAMHEHGKRRAG